MPAGHTSQLLVPTSFLCMRKKITYTLTNSAAPSGLLALFYLQTFHHRSCKQKFSLSCDSGNAPSVCNDLKH